MKIHSDYRAHRYLDIFPLDKEQINVSVIRPFVTCAFHRHKKQRDYWVVVKGTLEVKIVNPSTDAVNTYILRDGLVYECDTYGFSEAPLTISPGLWHGYRNVGTEDAVLIYYCTEKYNSENPDEERITPEKLEVYFDTQIK